MPIIDDEFLSKLEYRPLFEQELPKESQAFDKICRWVQVRDRSEAEVRKRLIKEAFPASAIERSIERARSCGLLDDSRFARVLVRSRLNQGKGKRAILQELENHEICPQRLSGWPEDFVPDDIPNEYARAKAYMQRHPPRSKQPRNACMRTLVSRGFSSDVAYRVACDYPLTTHSRGRSAEEEVYSDGFTDYQE